MSDTIGALAARITLQRQVRVDDSLGGGALGWADEGAAWADIRALAGSESAALDTLRAVSGYRVTIRRRGDVRAGWRVLWGARVLRVTGVRDESGPRIALMCEEEQL